MQEEELELEDERESALKLGRGPGNES